MDKAYFLLCAIITTFILILGLHYMGCVKGFYPENIVAMFKIKEKSWLRKLFPYKETEYNPYLYLTVIPCVIYFALLITTLVVYVIYWINPTLLHVFLESVTVFIISGCIMGLAVIIAVVVSILQHLG